MNTSCVERDDIKAKAEALRLTAEQVEEAAAILRVCLTQDTGQAYYLATARKRLLAQCQALIEAAQALSCHAEMSQQG